MVRLRATDPVDSHALLEDLVATLTPRFQVVRRVGQGGMGTVYLGWDPLLRRDVGIKVLTPEFAADASAKARFTREAQAAAAVAHPNVVSIFQVGELQKTGAPYFVMQFIDGQTLDDAFPRGKPAAQSAAKRIIGEVAAALGAAHARGLVHRDIKPSNIMLDAATGRAIVLDFGISASTQAQARVAEKLTATGVCIGTPRYMSPEQAAGHDATDRSDVYSLGCVAFELLSGRPVFDEQSVLGLLAAHLKDKPKEIASLRLDLDADFAILIDQCLRKTGDTRPSAAQIAAALGFSNPPAAEWPPPGLETFQTNALHLWRALTHGAVGALIFLSVLATQPNLLVNEGNNVGYGSYGAGQRWANFANFSSGGAWRDAIWGFGGTSSRLTSLELSPGFGGTSSRLALWEFGATIALIFYAAFGVLLATKLFTTARDWWRGRLSGYSTGTIWRVLLTAHSAVQGDDRHVTAGATASAEKMERGRMLSPALVFTALLLTVLMPVAWSLGLLGFDTKASWFVLSTREFLFTLAPIGTLLLTALVLSRAHVQSRLRRMRQDWQLVSSQRFATTHPEVVVAWHRRSGAAAARPSTANSMLQITAIGVAILLSIAVSASTMTTILPYARPPAEYPDNSTDIFALDKQLGGLMDGWSESVMHNAQDSLAAETVTASAESIWRDVTDANLIRMRKDKSLSDPASEGSRLRRMQRRQADSILFRVPWSAPLDSAALARLRVVDEVSWVAFARRVAEAEMPSRWWFTDTTQVQSFAESADLYRGALYSGRARALETLGTALWTRIRLELADGKLGEARADLQRVARIERVLAIDNVSMNELPAGRCCIVFATALGELAREDKSQDESALAQRIVLIEDRERLASERRTFSDGPLDAVSFALLDPSARSLESFVADSAATLDVRAYTVMHFADAFCVSPREILLGIASQRLKAVDRAALQLRAQGYDGPLTFAARVHAKWLASGALSRSAIAFDRANIRPFSIGELLVSIPVLGRADRCRYFQLE